MPDPVMGAAARLAAAIRSKADPAVIQRLRDALTDEQIDAHARKIVARWPVLTDDQVDRVSRILRGAE